MPAHYPKQSLRIILLNDLLPPDHEGGLELSSYEIGNALRRAGHDVHFVCSRWRREYTGERDELPYIHRIFKFEDVRQRPESRLPKKLEALRAVERKINVGARNYRALRKMLRDEGPFDVALVFGLLGVGIATATAFSDCGIPVVWSIGDVALADHFAMPSKTRLYNLIFKTLGRRVHAIEKTLDCVHMTFVSDFSRGEMLKSGFKPKRTAVIPRGVDFEPFNADELIKEDPPVLFYAGRLAPSRGAHVAVEAAKLLAKRRPDLQWTLKIAGGSRDLLYQKELRERAAELGRRIEFVGKIPKAEVLDRMRRYSIFINSTVEVEGFGRSNIEAMANAMALVTTDIPSVHEIVDANHCALLFPSGDAAALSKHLENLLDDSTLRRTLAQRGVDRVRDAYLFERIIEQLEYELFEALSNSKQ